MSFRSVIFDFDGTLADTLEETRIIFNQLAPDYKFRPVSQEELAALRHLSLKELLSTLGVPKHRVPMLLARGTRLMRQRVGQLPLISGIAEMLHALRSRTKLIGVLTSNTTENVELFLETNHLRDYFDFISSTSKLSGKTKHLKAIRKTFSLEAEEILYIGDEIRDIRAAKKAHVAIAAVNWGFNAEPALRNADPDYIIRHPAELLSIVL